MIGLVICVDIRNYCFEYCGVVTRTGTQSTIRIKGRERFLFGSAFLSFFFLFPFLSFPSPQTLLTTMVNFITVPPSSSTAIYFLRTLFVEHKWLIRLTTAVISLHYIYNKITKPPASLRHLPQADYFAVLKAIKNSKPIDQVAHEITFPTVANSNHGLYMVSLLFSSYIMLHIIIFPSYIMRFKTRNVL